MRKKLAFSGPNSSRNTYWTSFCNEIQISGSIPTHRNIVRVFGGLVCAKNISDVPPFLCMEKMDMSLDQFLKERSTSSPLQIADIMKVLLDICLGMNYLHCMNLSHRDLHPGNIFVSLSPHLVAKISGFELGKQMENVWLPESTSNTPDIGTRKYRAPEVYTTHYGCKCDIWSFGILVGDIFRQNRNIEFSDTKLPEDKNEWFEEGELLQHMMLMFSHSTMENLAFYRLEALDSVPADAAFLLPMLKNCLNLDASSRPAFYEIVGRSLELQEKICK